MDKYFVLRVKYLKDGTIKKSEVMEYSDRQAALAKYHTNMGTDMSDNTLSGSMCTVIDQYGNQLPDAMPTSWGHIAYDSIEE